MDIISSATNHVLTAVQKGKKPASKSWNALDSKKPDVTVSKGAIPIFRSSDNALVGGLKPKGISATHPKGYDRETVERLTKMVVEKLGLEPEAERKEEGEAILKKITEQAVLIALKKQKPSQEKLQKLFG